MNRLEIILLCTLIFCLTGTSAVSQCDNGITTTNYSVYVYRVGPGIFMGGTAYSTGADANYVSTTLVLHPQLNLQPIESDVSSTAAPNQTASPSLSFDYHAHGYGNYVVSAQASTYDSCSGRTAPPFQTGIINGMPTPASLMLYQPTATFGGRNGSSIYADAYSQYNPNGSVPVYPTTANLTANNNNGITGATVNWALSGQTQAITTSCQNLGLPCQFMNVQTNGNARAVAGCQPAITAAYTIDGLDSNTVNIMILSSRVQDAFDPSTAQHAVHNALVGGYQSLWYFQDVDSCGTPLAYVHTHEAFPNGFTYLTQSNWAFISPNDWYAAVDGGWYDRIEFTDGSGQAVPTPSQPQSPLNATQVYSGTQQIFIDPVPVSTWTQIHFLDHGGYQ